MLRRKSFFTAADLRQRSLDRGRNDDSLARLKEIKAELLMLWGRQDPPVPPEGRTLIDEKMTGAGLRFSWAEFNAAYAFPRDEGPRYDPELAPRGYGMVVDLFRRELD